MFFDYFVSTQQHFESRLFWKNAEKLRKHAQLKSYVLNDDLNKLKTPTPNCLEKHNVLGLSLAPAFGRLFFCFKNHHKITQIGLMFTKL